MEGEERISLAALFEWVNRLVVEHIAKPEEAKQLLGEFVMRVCAGESVPEKLLGCLRDVFRGYLQEDHKTLDHAFLFDRDRRRHPPVADDSPEELDLAVAILDARLRNPEMPHEETVERVSERIGSQRTKIGKVWSRRHEDALHALRLIRAEQGNDLGREELARA